MKQLAVCHLSAFSAMTTVWLQPGFVNAQNLYPELCVPDGLTAGIQTCVEVGYFYIAM